MSWWDASGIGGLATQALKKAQKGIDKVLDISEEEAGAGSSATKDVRAKTPDGSSDEKNAPQEGGEFFDAWLSPKAAPTEAADKPKKPRTLSGAKKITAGDSRKTSTSSSVSDADIKDTKPNISRGSESAFKKVSSSDPVVATAQSGSMFVDTSQGDEDVFKQFDMAPEKKADVTASMLQENQYSQSLSLQAKDGGVETKTEKETADPPAERSSALKSEKRKGPLKLGSKSKETDKTKPPVADSGAKDTKDKTDSARDIPEGEDARSTPLLSVAAADPFAVADTGPSDWSDMSLSLLTESQMSGGSGKSAETETPEMVASDIKSDDVPSVPVTEDDKKEKSTDCDSA